MEIYSGLNMEGLDYGTSKLVILAHFKQEKQEMDNKTRGILRQSQAYPQVFWPTISGCPI